MKYILFITIFLMSRICFAQLGEIIDAGGGVVFEKPLIDQDKLLDENEQKLVQDVLWNEDRKMIFKYLVPAKNDYHGDYDRGTVKYTTMNRNYAFSEVIIPDGTTVKDCNFTQFNPDTDAISGEDLVLIDCNLCNVRINPSWKTEGCLIIDKVIEVEIEK